MDTKVITGAEVFLRQLSGMGVDTIFASPGSEWSPVWEQLAHPDLKGRLRYLSSRHEEIALGMASGYAKATGKLPAVMIHTTVGALHGAMAMRAALHENIPMVIFTGESIGFGEDEGPDPGQQWLRNLSDIGGPARLVEHCVKWSFGVNNKSVLPSTIQRACQIAMAPPRGPVFISLPMEFLFEAMSVSAPAAAAIPHPTMADPAGLDELAVMLLAARNPVIVTETGGRAPGAAARLVELAELLGAAVVESRSPGCVNFPRSHPLHAGFDTRAVVKDADMVFMVGAIAPWHPPSSAPNTGARVALLDENPLRTELPYFGYRVDLCLTGGVENSLAALLERLRKRIPAGDPTRAAAARLRGERKHALRQTAMDEAADCQSRRPIDARWLAHELNQVMPADAIVVEETITHRPTILRYLDKRNPGSGFNGSVGGLGTSLGTALGVKSAVGERPVIALVGDGSFNYNPVPAGLGFAQEYGMPILIVLFNNSGYQSQKSDIPRYYPDGWAVKSKTFVGTSITPAPDYAAFARAFDGYGETVEDPAEVRPALERGLKALAAGRLALIDVRLEPVN